MKYRYFKLTKDEAKSTIQEIKNLNEKRAKLFDELFSEYETTGEIGNNCLIVKNVPNTNGYRIEQYKNGTYKISPDKRTTIGREFEYKLSKFRNSNKRRGTTSEYIVEKYKIHRLCQEGRYAYFSVGCVVGDEVIIKIPDSKTEENNIEKFPLIPECFEEIRESEFIRIIEEANEK